MESLGDLLGKAEPEQLLMFMSLPLMGALVLFGFLTFSFTRRSSKKPKTKSGSEWSTFSSRTAFSVNPVDLNPDVLPHSSSLVDPTKEATVSLDQTLSRSSSMEISSLPEHQLNLDILNRHIDMETSMMDTSQDKIDLATQLGNLSASQPQKQSSISSEEIQQAEPVELLRLLRHPESGQLIIEIAGRRYTKLAEIVDKEIGQYVLKLAAHLLAFTNGMLATEAGIQSVPAPKVGKTPLPLGTSFSPFQSSNRVADTPSQTSTLSQAKPTPPEPRISPAAEAAFLASLQTQPPKLEPSPQRQGLFGRSKPANEPIMLPSLNLAEEINKIAQARLIVSPLAMTTKLEIVSKPEGGLQINVNGVAYASPDQIPDPEVKTLIKDSIKQWERS